MDRAFRMRLRKAEGVSKKGPVVARHPSSSSSATAPTSANSFGGLCHSKEVRPTVVMGMPILHRRRPLSPDPRNGRRQFQRDSPPRSPPVSSPVRQCQRDRSNSPSGPRKPAPVNRVPNYLSGTTVSSRSRSVSIAPPSSPPTKRLNPPSSMRSFRPLSPVRKLQGPLTPLKGPTCSDSPLKSRHCAIKCFHSTSTAGSPPPSPGICNATMILKHSATSTSSRPSSPGSMRGSSPRGTSPRGTSPRGRGSSPGSKPPPISSEILTARVHRALKARLYLLHQPGPNSFSIGGDSPTHKYKVIIGPQTCSCGQGPYCVHVLFVMVRVLQLVENDPLLSAGSLKDYEVEQLLRGWEERRKNAIRVREKRSPSGDSKEKFTGGVSVGSSEKGSPQSSPTTPYFPGSEMTCEDDTQCPICLMVMVEGESLVACEAGCHNFLHHHCMAVWAADRYAQGQPLLCPLCRAPWSTKTEPHLSPRASYSSFSNYSVCSSVINADFAGREALPRCPVVTSRSKHDSGYSTHTFNRSSFYPPTVRGEISAFPGNPSEDVVPLPRSDPIPVEHEEAASSWIYVFGRDLVACLFSRDWAVREAGLRRLSHEVLKVLQWDCLSTTQQMQQKVVHCCANILAHVANDPVYKVYLACLRCFRILLVHLCPTEEGEVEALQELLRPFLHTLLLKCADGNRRTSQISLDSIIELCRGQRGELALGIQSGGSHASPGLGGISYILSCILEDSPPNEAPWQWLLGRLCVLDCLLDEFPQEFQLQIVQLNSADSGYKLQHYDRLMTVVEFAFKALGSNHATVSKFARRIYICGAKMAAVEPAVFNQVCEMLANLDVSLQMRLKRRLKAMQGERRVPLFGDKFFLPEVDRLVRSVSHSPSRLFSALRSPSQSHAVRQSNFSRPVKVEESQDKKFFRVPPRRPNYLPLNSFDMKFKEKQARLRLYHKNHAKYDLPFIVQQAVISPNSKEKILGKKFVKEGLSHNYVSPHSSALLQSPPEVYARDVLPILIPPIPTPIMESFPNGLSHLSINGKETSVPGLSEDPLPIISSLNLVPKYLIERSSEQIREGSEYEEGRDWVKGPLLGTGAFSSCYQARDVETGSIMAVKQLSVCRNSEEEQERVEAAIEEEILMMSKLEHVNVVRLLGATRIATSFCVFSEWMAGGSVAGMLEKYGVFSETVIVKYTKQLLEGLAYLHDNMILHRDLKGANLLVDSTGHWLRIGDFGTATRLASKATVTGEFQGQLLGTIAFMAPEVLRGDDYGRACDMWSVGCCIIEMATTKPPWNADIVSNQYKLMFKIATSAGPPNVPETLSKSTRDVALQCLRVNSELRPSAKELLRYPFDTHPP